MISYNDNNNFITAVSLKKSPISISKREKPNPTSTAVNLPNKKPRYIMNDLCSVYTHYDAKLGKNVATENKL